MSTNFYFYPSSGELARFKLHIGKQAGGWEFMFHGYDVAGGMRELDGFPGLSIEVDVPALSIKSHLDWLKYLRETPGVIKNEYHEVLSIEEFEEQVEALSPGKTWGPDHQTLLQNHHQMLVDNEQRYGKVDPEKNWQDARGFSFTNCDFS